MTLSSVGRVGLRNRSPFNANGMVAVVGIPKPSDARGGECQADVFTQVCQCAVHPRVAEVEYFAANRVDGRFECGVIFSLGDTRMNCTLANLGEKIRLA